jgi:hypothetical protein
VHIPSEFAIGEILMPPLVPAGTFGLMAALITAQLLNRFRLSKHFFYPPLVFVALVIIYTLVVGAWIIPV